MATDRTISEIDLSILDILQTNARETQADIARAVGLAPSAILERIRKLEARGVIRGYAVQIDPRALDLGMLAFVSVRSEHGPGDDSVARSLADCPEVLEVHHVAGEDCYLVKVRARDAEHLGSLLRTRFRPHPRRHINAHDHRARNDERDAAPPHRASAGDGLMTPSSHRQRRLAYVAWVMVCLIWGTTYLGIRISLESMPPALMGGLRWTIAGALLASYVALKGHQLPPPSRWGGILLLGFLLLVLGNGGVVVAEQWVPSGLAAVLVACSPFWMAAVEACLPDGDRLRGKVIVGLLVGFAGILVLVWPDLKVDGGASRGFLAGVIALQIAAFGWSLGSAYSAGTDDRTTCSAPRRTRCSPAD